MTKPVVVIPPAPDAPGILHVDTDSGKLGPLPAHDVGREPPGESPSIETIRQLAYAMWEARGRAHGSSELDWLAAEREVLGRHAQSAESPEIKVSEGLGLETTPPSRERSTR